MLSFFKFPFNSRKQKSSEENHENVLLDILRKRRQSTPSAKEGLTKHIVEKYREKFDGRPGAPASPAEQYEAMRKILQDLDNELR